LEVVVGAHHLPNNNNSLEKQKLAFSAKNCVVVLSRRKLKTWFDGRRKNGAHVGCVFSSFGEAGGSLRQKKG
jgi:hypothetical protein